LGNTDEQNELVFRHAYLDGKATTREILYSYRTEAHAIITKRIGIKLFYIGTLGDIVPVVTRKEKKTARGVDLDGRHQGQIPWLERNGVILRAATEP